MRKNKINFLVIYLLAIIFCLLFCKTIGFKEETILIEWSPIYYRFFSFVKIQPQMRDDSEANKNCTAPIHLLPGFANIRAYRLRPINRRTNTREKGTGNGFSKDIER